MSGYIHGWDPVEVARLVRQARVLARWTMDGVQFPRGGLVAEVGCGVGAELMLLADLHPEVRFMGLDLSASQIDAARSQLTGRPIPLLQASGAQLPFADGSLDGIFTCWLLEHVPDPSAVVAECRRVLKPGAPFYAREVDNDSFRIWPESGAVDRMMEVLNRVQRGFGGDPVVGRRLHALLIANGFSDLRMSLTPVYTDATHGAAHRELCTYFHDLLASTVPACVAAGLAESVTQEALAHLASLADNPVSACVHVARFAVASA